MDNQQITGQFHLLKKSLFKNIRIWPNLYPEDRLASIPKESLINHFWNIGCFLASNLKQTKLVAL